MKNKILPRIYFVIFCILLVISGVAIYQHFRKSEAYAQHETEVKEFAKKEGLNTELANDPNNNRSENHSEEWKKKQDEQIKSLLR